MAIDFGRAARGIATGYISAKVADTAAQDELNRDFILQARNQYFNVDKPNFIADEKKRSANIDFVSTKLSPVYANYADAANYTFTREKQPDTTRPVITSIINNTIITYDVSIITLEINISEDVRFTNFNSYEYGLNIQFNNQNITDWTSDISGFENI